MEKNECGLACIAMLFHYLDYNISLNTIRRIFPSPKSGLSFKNMMEICDHYGFSTEAFRISQDNIKILDKNSIPLPVIAQWNEGIHYVVIEKFGRNHVELVDPSLGVIRVEKSEFLEKFTGNVLYIERKGESKKVPDPNTTNTREKVTNFLKTLKTDYILAIFVLLLSVAGLLFNAVPNFIFGKIVDQFLDYSKININLLLIIILISCAAFILNFLKGKYLTDLTIRLDNKLMSLYLKHFFSLPMSFFDNRQKGDLLNRTYMLVQIREMVTNHMIGIALNFLVIIIYSILLLRSSLHLGLITIIWGCVIVLLLTSIVYISYNLSKKALLTQTKIQNFIAESINNIYDIKSYAFEEKTYSLWKALFNKYLQIMKNSNIFGVGINSFIAAMQLVQSLGLFVIGSVFVSGNYISFGDLFYIIMLADLLIAPIFSSCSSYFSLIQLSTVFQRVKDILEHDSELGELNFSSMNDIDLINKPEILDYELRGKIEFKNVSFQYTKFDPLILDDVSFVINVGETVWIQGESGSGKSTILKLILGFYKATEGVILIDDKPIDQYDIRALRNSFSAVMQESNLFNKSILENITFDKEIYDRQLYEKSVNDAKLTELLAQLVRKDETIVSEGGNNFSGGQKQRILLARALYKNNNVLILDEATNSLDKESENYIIENIINNKRTKVFITHDLILPAYDKRLIVSGGKVGMI